MRRLAQVGATCFEYGVQLLAAPIMISPFTSWWPTGPTAAFLFSPRQTLSRLQLVCHSTSSRSMRCPNRFMGVCRRYGIRERGDQAKRARLCCSEGHPDGRCLVAIGCSGTLQNTCADPGTYDCVQAILEGFQFIASRRRVW